MIHGRFTDEQRQGLFKPAIAVPSNASAQAQVARLHRAGPLSLACQAPRPGLEEPSQVFSPQTCSWRETPSRFFGVRRSGPGRQHPVRQGCQEPAPTR
jgi:hypothetical protein